MNMCTPWLAVDELQHKSKMTTMEIHSIKHNVSTWSGKSSINLLMQNQKSYENGSSSLTREAASISYGNLRFKF